MGLFGSKKNKEKKSEKIPVQYYDGELNGFPTNFPCGLLLTDEALIITRINPEIEVKLDRKRILSIDIFFEENQYMAKFKGVNISTSQCKGMSKHYYVLNYLGKDGERKHLDFWGTVFETGKVQKMNEKIMETLKSTSYEI
ncbi:MAG: hypothetical protein Q4E24_13410 [bacterium]|nr:hypothetical protein [bacterium]